MQIKIYNNNYKSYKEIQILKENYRIKKSKKHKENKVYQKNSYKIHNK